MSNSPPVWSSDSPISAPQPPANQIIVPMFGFGMTEFGLVHDLTDAEYEYLRSPSYAPHRPTNDVVYEDQDV